MDGERLDKPNPNLILPVGTQVVTLVEIRSRNGQPLRRSGSVGKVTKAPTDNEHAYQVQFPDGGQTSLHRQELATSQTCSTELEFRPPGGRTWRQRSLRACHLSLHCRFKSLWPRSGRVGCGSTRHFFASGKIGMVPLWSAGANRRCHHTRVLLGASEIFGAGP